MAVILGHEQVGGGYGVFNRLDQARPGNTATLTDAHGAVLVAFGWWDLPLRAFTSAFYGRLPPEDEQRPLDRTLAGLLDELHIDRFEPIRRWHGEDHVVDESILHATATGHPFGFDGRDRPVTVRFLHIFDFRDGLISRESAWIDFAAIAQQLA